METHIEWASPAALWDQFRGPTNADQRRIFRTPAILRFSADEFMPDFINLMQTDARRVSDILAVPETWMKPSGDLDPPIRPKKGLVGQLERARIAAVRKLEARQALVRTRVWNDASDTKPLKLYQPAHQRYYLVAASLVCRTLGLPDRPLDTTKAEKATFVMRMLDPLPGAAAVNPDPLQCDELALVGDEWVRVTDRAAFVEGETQYPLSPLTYSEIDGRRRRLLNGMIPVAKREALLAAKMPNPAAEPPRRQVDTRQILLKTQVVGPWSNLEDAAKVAAPPPAGVQPSGQSQTNALNAGIAAAVQTANEQIQTISWYILLDLDQWLNDNLHEVWDAITQSPAGLSAKKLPAYQKLSTLGLIAPLANIRPFRAALESVKSVYRQSNPAGWPNFTFQFVQSTAGGPTGLTGTSTRDDFESALVDALDDPLPSAVPVRSVAQANAIVHRSPWFTVRCVFERPNCSVLSKPVVSDPTASFQMASFFDSDAPARPIRVPMPADTTPAGLRKYDKNTAFVLSDVLCGQVKAVRGLGFVDLVMSVLPWPLHKDLNVTPSACTDGGFEAGMVCSFSIPIITICALILLMIIVKLLDIIFFWMPFFQICLPVPKFDAKGES